MLCSLCQHGTTTTWNCPCGETHCRHIWQCKCGRSIRRRYRVGDVFQLLQAQTDDNDRQVRETRVGALVVVSRIIPENSDNPYVVSCPSNGAWWFFSQAELERQARLIDLIKPPAQGDYLGLGRELHTIIDKSHGYDDAWLVEDNQGEDYRVVRDPDNDNDTRRAWKLA